MLIKVRLQKQFIQQLILLCYKINPVSIVMGCQKSSPAVQPLKKKEKTGHIKIDNQHSLLKQSSSIKKDEKKESLYFQIDDTALSPKNDMKSDKKLNSSTPKKDKSQKNRFSDQKSNKNLSQISTPEKNNSQQKIVEVVLTDNQLIQSFFQLILSRPNFNNFLDREYFCQALLPILQNHLDHHTKEELLSIITTYISSGQQETVKEALIQQKIQFMGNKIQAIKKQSDKNSITVNKIINKLSTLGQNQDFSMIDLRFDMSSEQFQQLVKLIQQLVPLNEKSLFFLFLYLYASSVKLQAELLSLVTLQQMLNQCFNKIIASFPKKEEWSTPLLTQSDRVMLKKYEISQYEKNQVDFSTTTGSVSSKIDQIVSNQSKKAEKYYQSLSKHLRSAVTQNCKIYQNDSSDWSMMIFKKKMMDASMQKFPLQNMQQANIGTLEQLYKHEMQLYGKQLSELFGFIQGKIQIKMYDILYAHILFNTISQIFQALDKVCASFKKNGYKLIQISNKLQCKDGVSELVLTFIVDTVQLQIHLILQNHYKLRYAYQIISQVHNFQQFNRLTAIKMISKYAETYFFEEFCPNLFFSCNKKQIFSFETIQIIQRIVQKYKSSINYSQPPIPKNGINQMIYKSALILHNNLKSSSLLSQKPQIDKLKALNRLRLFKQLLEDTAGIQKQQFDFFKNVEEQWIQFQTNRNRSIDPYRLQLLKQYAQFVKKLGLKMLKQKWTDKAISKFEQFISISSFIKNKKMVNEGKRCLAEGLLQKGSYIEAIKLLQKCFKFTKAQKMENTSDQIPFLKTLGNVYVSQQNFQLALKSFQKGYSIMQKSNHPIQQKYHFLFQMAKIYQQQNDYKNALKTYKQCRQISQKINGNGSFECVHVMMKQADQLHNLKNYEESLKIYKKNLNIVERVKSQGFSERKQQKVLEVQGMIRKRLAENYQNILDMKQSFKNWITFLKILQLRRCKDTAQYCETLQKIAQIHQKQSSLSQSIKFYEQSISIREKISKSNKSQQQNLSKALQKASKILQKQGNKAKSILYHQKSTKLKEKMQKEKEHITNFINIAKKSLQRGNYPLSLKYYEKCLSLLTKGNRLQSTEAIQIYKNIGQVYKLQNRQKDAIANLQQGLNVLEKVKGKHNIQGVDFYFQLAESFNQIGQTDMAQTYYLAAIHLCDKFNVKYYAFAKSNLGLGNIYFDQFQASKAYQCYQKALPLLQKMNPTLYQQTCAKMEICDKAISEQFPQQEGSEHDD